ncbi:hypothetical protein ACI2IY_10325 [Lysobacter enzymogenes]|uniref:hypothetical protein n=1 Tax=Lysobacter enzymogenes TaxID=69 RepID=UPI00384D51EF
MHHEPSQELPLRLSAIAIALASTAFMVWLLMTVPTPLPRATQLDVVWIERVAPADTPEALPEPPPQRSAATTAAPARTARSAAVVPLPVAPARSAPKATPAAPAKAAPSTPLYTAEGRVALAANPEFDPMKRKTYIPGSDEDPAANQVRNAFQRPNPLPPQPGGFAMATDGTLGEALMEKLDNRLKKIAEKLPGRKQIQEVTARPPPPVRFNPALHERPSDLGSEATGDAYKAAPIAFERAPGLKGEASARIRAAIGELETRRRECGLERLRQWLAPALAGLDELQRIEYAYGHGADPVSAQQLLPRSADMAYDRARRAIWYADKQGERCAKS